MYVPILKKWLPELLLWGVQDVCRFLCTCGFFRRYIERLSSTVRSLSKLTKKGIKFNWGDAEQTPFDALMEALVEALVLRLLDFSRPSEVHTCMEVLGAALIQCDAPSEACIVMFLARCS